MELVIGFCHSERNTVVKRLKNRDWNVKEPKISVTKYGGWLQISGQFAGFVIVYGESKVKKVHPCTGRTAHRGSRGIAPFFLDHGTRGDWGASFTPWPLFTPGKIPVPNVHEAGWDPGPVWTGAENVALTGIRFSDRPACRQSLYGLSYRAHKHVGDIIN